MNTTVRKFGQWAVLSALCIIGCIAFMVLVGDENPMNPMPLSRWLLLKAAAGVVLYVCYKVARLCHRHGYLPEYLDKMVEEDV